MTILVPRDTKRISRMEGDLQTRYDNSFAWSRACSEILALPGLRGFWPMSSYYSGGDAADLAGFDAVLTRLTYNGNPVYNYDGLAPYIRFDGTGDYLSHIDNAHYDILGTEAYVGMPGLTLGGWFYIEDVANAQGLVAKYGGAGTRSYLLWVRGDIANDPAQFVISDDGTAVDSVFLVGYTVNTWHYIVGRFNDADAGAELKVWFDGNSNTAATARNAIFDGAAAFTIGSLSGGGSLMTGRASLCWLCASALSDTQVLSLFHQQCAMYGVRP